MPNYDWEIENLRQQVSRLEEKIRQKGYTLYGNGQEGLTSRVTGLEDDMEHLKAWMDKWTDTTNTAEYVEMRRKLEYLSRWNSWIWGGLAVLTLLIQVLGPKIHL